jgi:membrane fusion protein, multidrug efflux system
MKLFIITLSIVAAGFLFWTFNPAKGTDVKVVQAKMMPAIQAVYATGTVEATRMIAISPKIAARLVTLEVYEGAHVEKGDVLAQLEDADVQESVRDFQAKLELAKNDLDRAQKLAKFGVISKEALDQSQAIFKSAAAALDKSKIELGYLQLTAPERGTIIRRDGEIGEMIAFGTPVFWISGGDELRIETEVDEEDISLVQPGQRVIISADAYPEQIFEGSVQSITPKGDPVARSYRVRVGLEGKIPLMIGMTAETNIITKETDSALMLPAAAVSNGYVLILSDGLAKSISVKTGIKAPQAIEILEGISKDDKVAAVFSATLLSKKNLHPKDSEWKVLEQQ